ncbi:uncharacterized protein [Aegilops tauschii subsp. strangulata]|uniref:uncharacterized protein isoform X7 n=1 Tax=Aegilops tauschii subsp. strangulata TaxID=200361 RepID=UPI00098AB93B|nr:uncharacterized protein LOC109777106 isoform X5 [Aegilops tauschii subsp. strangulata]
MEDAAPPPLQPEGTPPLLQPGVDFTFQRRDRRAVYLTRTWHRLQTNTVRYLSLTTYCFKRMWMLHTIVKTRGREVRRQG